MSHRIVLLHLMEELVSINLPIIKPEFAQTIAAFTVNEMTTERVCYFTTFLSRNLFYLY